MHLPTTPAPPPAQVDSLLRTLSWKYKEQGKLIENEIHLSPLALGTYFLGQHSTDLHDFSEVLKAFNRFAPNLIETATYYQNGQSEVLLGHLLNNLPNGTPPSPQVPEATLPTLVASKVDLMSVWDPDATLTSTSTPNLPEHFLEKRLLQAVQNSQRRLGRNVSRPLDLFMISEPEALAFLSNSTVDPLSSGSTHLKTPHLKPALKQVLDILEQFYQDGLIRGYGVSSQAMGLPYTDLNALSPLEFFDSKSIALPDIQKRPGLKCIEFPFNAIESAAFTDGHKGALQFALTNNLMALTNRPFNAFYKGKLIRLARPQLKQIEKNSNFYWKIKRYDSIAAQTLLQYAETNNSDWPEWKATLSPYFAEAFERESTLTNELEVTHWAHVLYQKFEKIQSLEHWYQILEGQILGDWDKKSAKAPLPDYWVQLFNAISLHFYKHQHQKIQDLEKAIYSELLPLLKPEQHTNARHPLETLLLKCYWNTPGVTCVLSGMRDSGTVNLSINAILESLRPNTFKPENEHIFAIFEIIQKTMLK